MMYDRLRLANVARQAEWPGGENIDLAFRGLELGGEVGELLNLIKKHVRLEEGISGTAETYGELRAATMDEIGDVIICLDLLAMSLSLSIQPLELDPIGGLAPTLANSATALNFCAASAAVFSTFSQEEEAQDMLNGALFFMLQVCNFLEIDPWRAVERKFNKTSEKHGLTTRF